MPGALHLPMKLPIVGPRKEPPLTIAVRARPLALQFLQVDDVVVRLRPQLEDPGRFFGAGEFFLDEHRQFAAADAGAAARLSTLTW